MSMSNDLLDFSSADVSERDNARSDNQLPKGRAIVTYGRSLIALVIARSLHEQGVEVIGCDDVGMTVLSFSKHVSDNFVHASLENDEEQALTDLEEAVRKYAPEDGRPYVLIPSFRDAKILAKHRDRFEPLVTIAAPDEASINLVNPKDQFAKFAQENGLAAPETQIVQPNGRSEFDFSTVNFPVIAKPSDGVGGRGVEKIDSADELKAYLEKAEKNDPILLQEPIDGEDYCVSVIAQKGELVGIVTYRNERQFPIESGAGAVRETVDHAPFLETTKALLKATKWNGVCEIDYRWDGDPDSEPKLIEVNPRYWAGLFHSTASGVDFPWLAYQLAVGKKLSDGGEQTADIGFKSKTPAAWLLSIVEDVASSDENLHQSARAWRAMKAHVSKGNILSATRRFLKSAGHGLTAPAMLSSLQDELKKHSDLPSEFTDDDDPAVGLGILFALSSLARHGELPPELKFDVDPKEDNEDPPEQSTTDENTRPVIGITKPDNGDWFAYQAMKFAVWLAGGKPVKITSKAPRDPHSIDGLIFGGGSDVYPERYHGEVLKGRRYNLARDEMEASWADVALKQDIPVLGVCRGMQMLNVLQGGTLYPDLHSFENADYPMAFLKRIFYRKPIEITEGSWLACHAGKSKIAVNSIHTQAVKDLGTGFEISAREPNGIIQSIEHKTARFMVGVQFHPELMVYRKDIRNIFRAFIDCAKACRDSRT